MGKATITFITDFGQKDWFVGTMKGLINKINPQAEVIDVSHQIRPQHIRAAAFALKSAYHYFRPGTIHVVIVDPGVGSARRPIAVKAGQYLFVSPDNGLLSYIYKQEKVKEIVAVTNKQYFLPSTSSTFHGRDIFAPVAAYLSKGVTLREMGPRLRLEELVRFDIPEPKILKKGKIVGHVIYIDIFGNLITDITLDFWQKVRAAHRVKACKIIAGSSQISGIGEYYRQAKAKKPLALFGSSNHLEISVNLGDASRQLKMKEGDKVFLTEKGTFHCLDTSLNFLYSSDSINLSNLLISLCLSNAILR